MLDKMSKDPSQIISQQLLCACTSGAWLMVIPNKCQGATVSAEKFRDCIWLQYGIWPLLLPIVVTAAAQDFLSSMHLTARTEDY